MLPCNLIGDCFEAEDLEFKILLKVTPAKGKAVNFNFLRIRQENGIKRYTFFAQQKTHNPDSARVSEIYLNDVSKCEFYMQEKKLLYCKNMGFDWLNGSATLALETFPKYVTVCS